MSDSGLSYIGLNCSTIGLIRYRTDGLQSDKYLSDIGLIDVGYRISATKIYVAPTYDLDGKYADISFTDSGHSAQLHYIYRFESETLLKPANQVEPFYIEKNDISKVVAFLGAILRNLNIKFKTFVRT
jgi:hypothetical protein